MGLSYRGRKRLGRNTRLNFSRRGGSIWKRLGRLTVNSRGGVRARLSKGLSRRIR